MATGVYGQVRPASVTTSDIDIFFTFSSSRENISTGSVNRLDPNDVLIPVNHPDQTNQVLGGLYSLKLSANIFNIKGFYNIIIRPKEFQTRIVDCGVLAALPDVKGLILDTNRPELSEVQNKFVTAGLVGHRIEYIEADGSKTPNIFRIVTSSNRCEPVTENLDNTTQKAVKYRFTETGSLVFLTVTPSSAPSVKPNAIPDIGQPNQEIIVTNTYFDPVPLEIEMTDQTIDTLSIGMFGDQTKSLGDGVRTIYDFDQNIYKQFNEFEIRDEFANPTFEVREQKEVIDQSKIFSDIVEGL